MKILLNGDETEVADGTTVADLLRHLNRQRHVAVEVNLEVVPRTQHGQHVLQSGDSVELVTLVGGG